MFLLFSYFSDILTMKNKLIEGEKMKFEFNELYCLDCKENISTTSEPKCTYKGKDIAKCIYEQAVDDTVFATNLLKSAQKRREELIYKLIEEQEVINKAKKILDTNKLLIKKMELINEKNDSCKK